MFEDMDDRGFAEFLAALWEQRGWETGIQEEGEEDGVEEGTFMVTGDRGSGERGLMLVVPGTDAEVAGQPVQRVVGICDAKNVDLGVVATRGEFTEAAERIAEANDIHLLDPAALEETVHAEGLEDVVEEYASSGGSLLDDLSLPSVLPTVFRTPSPPPIPTRALTGLLVLVGVAALALVGLQTVGVLALDPGTLPTGGIGLGGGDDITVTAASLDGGTGSGLGVAWSASREGRDLDVNGTQYRAPEGEQFVVVAMRVTNDRPATSRLTPDRLAFAANGTVHGPHALENATGGLPVRLGPDESQIVWVAFTVDADADSGTLLGLPSENGPPLRFEHDPSIERATAEE